MTRLDDTTNCPVATSCEGCDTGDGLMVGTAATPVGVYCFTWCGFCAEEGVPPRPVVEGAAGLSAAVFRAGDHCVHLGIDVDEMGRLLDAEKVVEEPLPAPPNLRAIMDRAVGDPAAQAWFERLVLGDG